MMSTVQHLRQIGIRRRTANGMLALAILLMSLIVTARLAQAQTFTVLYAFSGPPDGASPYAGLIRDGAGNLYGTTLGGGDYDRGTVFKLDATGNETVLYIFGGTGGKLPYAGLIRDAAGNLYGTAENGGAFRQGTVFKLNSAGHLKVLHSFSGADGRIPRAGLIRDAAGTLYGTTTYGGTRACGGGYGCGTVFKLDTAGKYEVLYRFTGGTDGAYPEAGLIRDAAGNLYGVTSSGGDLACVISQFGCGTVFKVDTAGKKTVLYSFTGGADGAYPKASLLRDAAGNLYGTTGEGGDLACQVRYGCGTVFKLDTTGKETVLHTFTGPPDGRNPVAGLVRDAGGNFYGTSAAGGEFDWGTVFKLDASGKETVLHSFDYSDGALPLGRLILDAAGNLYGTTASGGASGFAGTVFKIAP